MYVHVMLMLMLMLRHSYTCEEREDLDEMSTILTSSFPPPPHPSCYFSLGASINLLLLSVARSRSKCQVNKQTSPLECQSNELVSL